MRKQQALSLVPLAGLSQNTEMLPSLHRFAAASLRSGSDSTYQAECSLYSGVCIVVLFHPTMCRARRLGYCRTTLCCGLPSKPAAAVQCSKLASPSPSVQRVCQLIIHQRTLLWTKPTNVIVRFYIMHFKLTSLARLPYSTECATKCCTSTEASCCSLKIHCLYLSSLGYSSALCAGRAAFCQLSSIFFGSVWQSMHGLMFYIVHFAS